MKTAFSLITLTLSGAALAANFGTTAGPAAGGTTTGAPAAAVTTPQYPGFGGSVRFYKPDGATLLQQAVPSASSSSMPVLNLSEADALVKSNGKCAFNFKYDELSPVAVSGTTNRIYSNDALIAQNTQIDLAAGVVKTIWTQPYLVAGVNNVKVMLNATGAVPAVGWVKVNVSGTCGGTAATTPPTTTKTPPPTTTPVTPPAAPVVFKPGSPEWNVLNNAWGYSNYAVTQLNGKGYSRYSQLVTLNGSIKTFIQAQAISQANYNSTISAWNGFVNDPEFKAAMLKVTPASGK